MTGACLAMNLWGEQRGGGGGPKAECSACADRCQPLACAHCDCLLEDQEQLQQEHASSSRGP